MTLAFPVTTEDVNYYPSDVPIPTSDGGAFAANTGPYFNYYRGAGSKPRKGRPCLLTVKTTRIDATLVTDPAGAANQESAFAAEMLGRGCTHINASLIIPDTTDPYEKFVSGEVTSGGFIHPPGVIPTGLSVAPYNHVNYPMYYKDAIYLIQFLKKNCATYEIDPDRIFVQGATLMNHALAWAVLKERALELGSASTDAQYGFSTRVAACFFDIPRASWVTQADAGAGSAITFPDEAEDWNTPAATTGDIADSYRRAVSLLGEGGYGDHDIIRRMPMYLSTGIGAIAAETGAVSTDFDLPFGGATEPIHSAWSCAVLRRFIDLAPVRFACGGTVAAAIPATVPNEDLDYTSDTAGTQRAQLVADQVAWAERYLLAGKPVLAAGG